MEAILKCYQNKACTRELAKDNAGNYILNVPILSSNNETNFKTNLFVKNAGTHKAYYVAVAKTSDTSGKAVLTPLTKAILSVGETDKFTVSMAIAKNETGTYIVAFKLDYDSI